MKSKGLYAKNIPLFYFSTFFSSLVFHRGIFILYLLHKGLSNTEIGVLQTSLFMANFALEIPTGILGDKMGRKWSVFTGLILTLINTIGMAFTNDFYLFLTLFIVEGAAFAFRSGSNTALLYESLKQEKREGEYIKTISRISSLSSILLGIGMAAGGFIKSLSWEYVYLAYAVAVFLASIFVGFMHEKKSDFASEKKDDKVSSMLGEIKNFFKTSNGKRLCILFSGVGIYNAAMTPYFVYGQNLFKHFGLAEASIGTIFCVVQISSGLLYLLAEKISDSIEFKKLIVITMISSSFLVFLNIFNDLWISLLTFYIVMVFPDIADILIDNHIQKRIPSEIRSTILSVKSFFVSVYTCIGYAIIGSMLDVIPIHSVYASLGIIPLLSLFVILYYFKVEKRDEVLEEKEMQKVII